MMNHACVTCLGWQARAHVLLKGKEAELRAARQAAALSPEHAARVAEAEAAAAAATRERDQAPPFSS